MQVALLRHDCHLVRLICLRRVLVEVDIDEIGAGHQRFSMRWPTTGPCHCWQHTKSYQGQRETPCYEQYALPIHKDLSFPCKVCSAFVPAPDIAEVGSRQRPHHSKGEN